MRRARRRGLAHEAADRVREAILEGRVPPGSALREVELASSLEVSRGSVREGLAILEREGLVRSEWHRGTRVIELTTDDVNEVYAVRAALERLATTLAARRMTPERTAELHTLVDAMEQALCVDADGPTLLALDLAFHDRIYDTAANSRLTTSWRGLRSQVHLFQAARTRLDRERYRSTVVAEHRALIRHLSGGATDVLAQAAEEHVDSARRALLDVLPGVAPAEGAPG
ncbi:GntR family transcriptional regulator [Nocardiopsis sp. EMB25]|uniref:GntR family transcriptional regulator n=1 Tax=Nocardiopsis sp. EMB25 TaxID=2835867 RepID=UPI002283D693|nr:GntR family transcriptional regulator [Nocardiopsis sp. EMB25]MCY9783609.1 GntR family transcriptional regulator [Nocardiopsis sp. EMB25]